MAQTGEADGMIAGRSRVDGEGQAEGRAQSFEYKVVTSRELLRRGVTSTARLYPFPVIASSDLKLALSRMDEGLASLDEAVRCLEEEDDLVSADCAVLTFSSVLPDLFLCQSIGEGFATSIVGLNQAVVNKHPQPFTLAQLQEVRYLLRKLREQPAVKTDEAIEWLMSLEDVGLVVDPQPVESAGDQEEETEV